MIIHEIKTEDSLSILKKTPAENRIFLDSASSHCDFSHHSFIMTSPPATYAYTPPNATACFDKLQSILQALPTLPAHPDIPFLGGICGLLPYELGQSHILGTAPTKDAQIIFGIYDLVFCFDHLQNKTYLISNGLCLKNSQWIICADQAKKRLQQGLAWLKQKDKIQPSLTPTLNFQSQHDDVHYAEQITRIKEYIRNGDIFQANLTSQYLAPADQTNTEALYCHLRNHNRAPFCALMEFDTITILSTSPERFIRLHQGQVSTCPIKGTAKRSADQDRDKQNQQTLFESDKERAENIMIVDLMRNDIAKVCEVNSVQVPKLCELSTFEHVHHLISTITGKLLPTKNAVDLLSATFPGGSITGAPKKRAMEIIHECEKTPRGPYCGSLFYISLCGNLDSSILIRTLINKDKTWRIHAGSGITLLSDELDELEEKKIKLQSFANALGTV